MVELPIAVPTGLEPAYSPRDSRDGGQLPTRYREIELEKPGRLFVYTVLYYSVKVV